MKGLDIWSSTSLRIFNYYGETCSQDRANQVSGKVYAYLSNSFMYKRTNLYVTKQHFYILHNYFSEKIIHLILEKVNIFDSFNAKQKTPLMDFRHCGFACEWLVGVSWAGSILLDNIQGYKMSIVTSQKQTSPSSNKVTCNSRSSKFYYWLQIGF